MLWPTAGRLVETNQALGVCVYLFEFRLVYYWLLLSLRLLLTVGHVGHAGHLPIGRPWRLAASALFFFLLFTNFRDDNGEAVVTVNPNIESVENPLEICPRKWRLYKVWIAKLFIHHGCPCSVYLWERFRLLTAYFIFFIGLSLLNRKGVISLINRKSIVTCLSF